MRLFALYEGNITVTKPALIIEAGYARVLNFSYDKFKGDPSPKILYLGKWHNRKTGNDLIGGVNLNYLTDEQLKKLRENLRTILRAGRTLKARWKKGNELLPEIFPNSGGRANKGAYRTYNSDMVHVRAQSTITPLDSDIKAKEEGDAELPLPQQKGKVKVVNKPVRTKQKMAPSTKETPKRASKKHQEKPKEKPKVSSDVSKKKEPKVVPPKDPIDVEEPRQELETDTGDKETVERPQKSSEKEPEIIYQDSDDNDIPEINDSDIPKF